MPSAAQLITTLVAAENRRDSEAWQTCLHPDVTYQVVGETTGIQGRDVYTRHMQAVYQQIPDWQFRELHQHGDADVILAEFVGAGHFTGERGGQTYQAAALELTAVCIFELRDGLIHRVREYLDAAGCDRQLQASNAV